MKEFVISEPKTDVFSRPGLKIVLSDDKTLVELHQYYDKNIIAVGMIIDKDEMSIYFKSLIEVKYPQPKRAPPGGFTYVDMRELLSNKQGS